MSLCSGFNVIKVSKYCEADRQNPDMKIAFLYQYYMDSIGISQVLGKF